MQMQYDVDDGSAEEKEQDMTFKQLIYVIEVAKYESINKAAEHLYTHQSNVSNTIRQLEDELGIQIFHRTQKGVQLTDEGRRFMVYAKEIVDKKQLIETMYSVRGHSDNLHFSVATMRSFLGYRPLIELIQQDRDLHTSANFRVQKCTMKAVFESVSNGDADLGIVFAMNCKKARLPQIAKIKEVTCTPLGESRLHVIVRENHPFLAKRDFTSLADYPYVVIENQENLSLLYDEDAGNILDLLPNTPRNIISTNDSMTCQDIISETDAFFVSTTPWKHDTHYRFASVPIPGEENTLTFYYILRKNYELPPLGLYYVQALQDLVAEL